MKPYKVVLIVTISLLAIGVLVFTIGYTNVFYTKTVGKSQQNAERQVFKETQPYNDGMAQQLSKLKSEYEQATAMEDKQAIEFRIRQDYADFDENNLQSEGLKNWLIKIRGF